MTSKTIDLYHFTSPVNAFQIALYGLSHTHRPAQLPLQTLGKPVVWLTEETSNLVDPVYDAWQRQNMPPEHWRSVNDYRYGGPLRCTVRLPRSSKRLKRWGDFMKNAELRALNGGHVVLTGSEALEKCRPAFPPHVLNQWWLYFGIIHPRIMYIPLTATMVREGCERLMENMKELELRQKFAKIYNHVATLAPEQLLLISETENDGHFRGFIMEEIEGLK